MGRGYAWFGTETYHSLVEASKFVRVMQKRTGTLIACVDEIASYQRFIDWAQLIACGKLFEKTAYGEALLGLAETT